MRSPVFNRKCLLRYPPIKNPICFVVLLLATSPITAAEIGAVLERKIQLSGLPNDEVPVVSAVAIQPHGQLLATAGDDHIVRLWDLRDGRLVRELKAHRDWVTTVSFCSDGAELITGSRDRQVLIWEAASGRMKARLGTHRHPISSIAVSQDKDRVAVAGFRAPLKVYDLASGKLLGALSCPCTDMRAIAFSPDMSFIAAGGRTGKLRIWNLKNGKTVDIDAHPRRIWSIAFTPDNHLISAGDDVAIHVWDSETGERIHRIANKSGKVLALMMIGDDQFAAASADNVIRLFELNASAPYAKLQGHTGSIGALDFRDNKLISGSFDTTVRVWSLLDMNATANRTSSTRIVPDTTPN